MGFHLNKVVFISINVELLTLKACFIFQIFVDPLLWGEASFCHILQPAGGGRSLLLLLPAADDFEKHFLLYFQLSDWSVTEIS